MTQITLVATLVARKIAIVQSNEVSSLVSLETMKKVFKAVMDGFRPFRIIEELDGTEITEKEKIRDWAREMLSIAQAKLPNSICAELGSELFLDEFVSTYFVESIVEVFN
jgi:hypothetical protein